jgi:hypothetical protein
MGAGIITDLLNRLVEPFSIHIDPPRCVPRNDSPIFLRAQKAGYPSSRPGNDGVSRNQADRAKTRTPRRITKYQHRRGSLRESLLPGRRDIRSKIASWRRPAEFSHGLQDFCTPSAMSQKGGEPTFAEAVVNSEVAPIPAVHGTAMEPRRSTKAVASAPALRGGADSAWIRSSDGVVTAPQNLGRTMSTALFGGAPRDG